MVEPNINVSSGFRSTSRYLGAMLSGLFLFLAGLLLWLAFPAIDTAISMHLHATSGTTLTVLLGRLTTIGSAVVMIPVGLLAFAWLMLTGRRRDAVWLFATIATGRIGIEAIKWFVDRARPPAAGRLVDVATASFPSSHSAGTMLTIVASCLIFNARWPVWAAGSVLIVCIGLSRIMLGVHWPSDVLAGWGLGLFWVMLVFSRYAASARPLSPVRPLRIRD